MSKKEFLNKFGITEKQHNQALNNYLQSDAYKNEMKKIVKNRQKENIKSFRKYVLNNIWNIISTIIGTTALIIAILAYLRDSF